MTNPVDSLGTGGGSSYYPDQDYLSTGGAPGHLEAYNSPSTYIPLKEKEKLL